MDGQASGWAEDDGAEVQYLVGPVGIDPDKHEVRTGVRYVGANRRLRVLAMDYHAMMRRLSGSDSVQAWTAPSSDGRGGDVHAVLSAEAMAALLERVNEMEYWCNRRRQRRTA